MGRIVHKKGLDILLKFSENFSFSFEIHIAGKGSMKKKLEQKHSSKNIKFLEYIYDKSKFFETIDVLVVPSRIESFGIVILEALSYNIPVILSDIDSFKEVFLGINGVSFFSTTKDLEKKLDEIKYLKKIDSNIYKKFSVENFLKKIEDIYKKR